MVYESRVGDVFLLGSSAWRIEDISHDQVLVTPAPGQPGRMPYWHGDAPGRPIELGRALGAFLRELSAASPADASERLRVAGLDASAATNLLAYLAEQREATGVLPDDRTILVERFRDELGDWRLAIHSPFGAQVNQPWAMAVTARLRETYGVDVQSMHSDDGIVLRLPETETPPSGAAAVFEPAEIEGLVQSEVGGSALFASRFRECASRALLLPRRNPTRRTPLWQQRQRASQLLGVAREYPSFPIVLETMREVLQDVFDVPGLVSLMQDVESRRVRFVEVETQQPSPFARSLLFGYIGQFMYEGDSPLAERRAQALSLDSALLAELLGQAELRELIDAEALDEIEQDLQRLSEDRQVRDAEGVADLLRVLGDLSTAEVLARGGTAAWLAGLEESAPGAAGADRRARSAGSRSRTPAGCRTLWASALPVGVPEAFMEPVRDPLGDLVSRFARTHGPFHALDVAARLGLGVAVVDAALAGCLRPAGWCTASSGQAAAASSGATPRCCGRCAVGRWPSCARRSSRSRPPRWRGSCLPGRASARPVVRAVSTGCCGRSSSCRARGARLGAGDAGAAVAGGRLLPRAARRADRVGRGAVGRLRVAARQRRLGLAAPGRHRSAAAARCSRSRRRRCTTPSSMRSPTTRRCSSARSPTASCAPTTALCSRRSGTWSGPGC